MDGTTWDEFVDLVDVARQLGVSYSRVWARAAGGQIPALRTPSGWRVRKSDLEAIRERFAAPKQTPKAN